MHGSQVQGYYQILTNDQIYNDLLNIINYLTNNYHKNVHFSSFANKLASIIVQFGEV